MEIRLKRRKVVDRTVVYDVGIRNEVVRCDEYCDCEVVFNFRTQREQKAVSESGCYDVVGYDDSDEGMALRLDGMRRLFLPRNALRKEPDDGAYYFYILGDRVKHCINKTICEVVRNELMNGRMVKIVFDVGK